MSRLRRLLNTHCLTFTRDVGGGFYGDDGRWVDDTSDDGTFSANGSLQPFNPFKLQLVIPEGVTQNDTRIFYTTCVLKTTSQFTQTIADTTIIDDLTFEVFSVRPWTGLLSSVNHYAAVLIRQDQLTELE